MLKSDEERELLAIDVPGLLVQKQVQIFALGHQACLDDLLAFSVLEGHADLFLYLSFQLAQFGQVDFGLRAFFLQILGSLDLNFELLVHLAGFRALERLAKCLLLAEGLVVGVVVTDLEDLHLLSVDLPLQTFLLPFESCDFAVEFQLAFAELSFLGLLLAIEGHDFFQNFRLHFFRFSGDPRYLRSH